MKILDRVGRYVLKNWAPARSLFSRAGEAIREARQTQRVAYANSESVDVMAQELSMQMAQMRRRASEYLDLRRAELACVDPTHLLVESSAPTPQTPAQFKERLWELELALEDRGWIRETTLSSLEFSRYGVGQLIRIARIYGIKNPLIKRVAEICSLYVFGRGVEIRSDDETANDVIQDFIDRNSADISHVGLSAKETAIQTDGSLYWGLPTDIKGNVSIQMVDAIEIMDIVTDPDDSSQPWFYHRQWTRCDLDPATGHVNATPQKCWYPSLEIVLNTPEGLKTKPNRWADIPVNWDMPILRDRAAGSGPSKWRWPIPPVYACIDWARAYKDFLEDWATVQRALSRFALMVETKGGPGAIAAYQALLSTTFANNDGTQIEQNPPPVTASAHVSGPGTTIQAFKSANVQTSPEQARRMLLMNAAGSGMPETFFGDASTGSLATAVSLDRPTELKFTEIQRRWSSVIKQILGYVLLMSRTSPGGKLKEAAKNNPAPQPPRIIVKFPTVVEHNIKDMMDALVSIGTCGGRQGIFAGVIDRRTWLDLALAEIGYEDRDELLDDIFGKDYNPAADVTDQRSQPAPQQITQPIGRALTSLSIPPPLPEPVAPPPSLHSTEIAPQQKVSPNGKPVPVAKEALTEAIDNLREVIARNGKG